LKSNTPAQCGPVYHCPHCRHPVALGVPVCSRCGASLQGLVAASWHRKACIVCSVLLIVQSLALMAATLAPGGWMLRYPFLAAGLFWTFVAIGLLRWQAWAIWNARLFGGVTLLWSGRWALLLGMSLFGPDRAAMNFAVIATIFLFWVFFEFVLWKIPA
jgi:hypothetical protein